MKTYSAKPKDINRSWYVIDASKFPLGRISTKTAELLMGKGKAQYTPHIDCGDYVIITNSDKLMVTGNKKLGKTYYRHTKYPGGLKEASLQEVIDKDSSYAVEQAIKRMLPDNRLRDERISRLKIYKGSEHDHSAQQPKELNLKGSK